MTQQWDETPERDMTEKDYGDEQQLKQPDLLTVVRNLHAAAQNEMCKEDADCIHITFWKGQWLAYNSVAGLVEHMDIITLTPALTKHYAALSAQTGNPVSELVARDLEEYLEYRRWLAREKERL